MALQKIPPRQQNSSTAVRRNAISQIAAATQHPAVTTQIHVTTVLVVAPKTIDWSGTGIGLLQLMDSHSAISLQP
jgi:hypothetical protein